MKKMYITPATKAKDLCVENIIALSAIVDGSSIPVVDDEDYSGELSSRQFESDFSSNWFE